MQQNGSTPADILYGFQNPEYDKAAKRLLSKKKILAHILKRTVPEFESVRYQDIADRYIEGEPEVGTVPVDKDLTNAVRLQKKEAPEIRGSRNEDASPTEGVISFDILFRAKAPVSGELITLIVNIEAQKQYTLPYPLMKRAVYYAGRLISSQKGVEFTNSDYGRLKKIYTIWLFLNGPAGKNAINRYELTEKNLFRHYQERPALYNLIGIVMVYVGRQKTKDRFLELLRLLFKEEITAAQKKEQLRDRYELELTEDMEKELTTMCNLSEGIAEKHFNKGIKVGEKRGKKRWTKVGEANILLNLWQLEKNMDKLAAVSGWTKQQIQDMLKEHKLI